MARLARIHTQIALATKSKVSGTLDGAHRSLNAGRSLEFHDVRDYVRGDDIADVDWKASARHGSLLVKRHVAERRATLLVALATGRSMAAMASRRVEKRELMLDAAATVASLALGGGDHVALLHWADGAVAQRPSPRAVRVERMLAEAEAATTLVAPDADLAELLELTAKSIRRRGIVAVICGDVDIDEQLEARLRRLAVQHDVMVIVVPDMDPADPHIHRTVVGVDDRRAIERELRLDAQLAAAWHMDVDDRAQRRTSTLARLAIPTTTLLPDEPVVPQLLAWLRSVRRAA